MDLDETGDVCVRLGGVLGNDPTIIWVGSAMSDCSNNPDIELLTFLAIMFEESRKCRILLAHTIKNNDDGVLRVGLGPSSILVVILPFNFAFIEVLPPFFLCSGSISWRLAIGQLFFEVCTLLAFPQSLLFGSFEIWELPSPNTEKGRKLHAIFDLIDILPVIIRLRAWGEVNIFRFRALFTDLIFQGLEPQACPSTPFGKLAIGWR